MIAVDSSVAIAGFGTWHTLNEAARSVLDVRRERSSGWIDLRRARRLTAKLSGVLVRSVLPEANENAPLRSFLKVCLRDKLEARGHV